MGAACISLATLVCGLCAMRHMAVAFCQQKKPPRACSGLGQAAAQEHDSGLGLVANSTCVKLQAAARQIVSKLPRPVSCNAAALSTQITSGG